MPLALPVRSEVDAESLAEPVAHTVRPNREVILDQFLSVLATLTASQVLPSEAILPAAGAERQSRSARDWRRPR